MFPWEWEVLLAGRCLISINPYPVLSPVEVCSLRAMLSVQGQSYEMLTSVTIPSHLCLFSSRSCQQGFNVKGDPWGTLMEVFDYIGTRTLFCHSSQDNGTCATHSLRQTQNCEKLVLFHELRHPYNSYQVYQISQLSVVCSF